VSLPRVRMNIGVNRKVRLAVAGRIGLGKTVRSCSPVVVEGNQMLADNLPVLPTAVRRHIHRHSLAEADGSHRFAVAEGCCWSAKIQDGARVER